MNQALLFLHLVGLMLGAAGGMSSGLIMRRAVGLPAEQAGVLRGLGPMLANVAAAGLALMWLSGLAMVWSHWNGPASLPGLFWVKAIFILTLTAGVLLTLRTYAEIRAGNAAVAARLPRLGPISGASALLAVLFAVLAFS